MAFSQLPSPWPSYYGWCHISFPQSNSVLSTMSVYICVFLPCLRLQIILEHASWMSFLAHPQSLPSILLDHPYCGHALVNKHGSAGRELFIDCIANLEATDSNSPWVSGAQLITILTGNGCGFSCHLLTVSISEFQDNLINGFVLFLPVCSNLT